MDLRREIEHNIAMIKYDYVRGICLRKFTLTSFRYQHDVVDAPFKCMSCNWWIVNDDHVFEPPTALIELLVENELIETVVAAVPEHRAVK